MSRAWRWDGGRPGQASHTSGALAHEDVGGAFAGLEKVIEDRTTKQGIGFAGTVRGKAEIETRDLTRRLTAFEGDLGDLRR